MSLGKIIGVALSTGALTLATTAPLLAADHADDVPLQAAQVDAADDAGAQGDINDIYAFMNPQDAEELVLVMTVVPDATASSTFSTSINYDFLIQNFNGNVAGEHLRISCNFPDTANISCSLGSLVTAGAVGTTVEAGNGLRVYTGLHDDPFFFNGGGLAMTLQAAVDGTENPTQFFASSCATQEGLGEAIGCNEFAGENILAIVLGVDRDLVTANQANPTLRLWAATESN